MNSKRTMFTLALALFALLAVVGVAVVDSGAASAKNEAAAAQSTIKLSTFKRVFRPTKKQSRARNAIRRYVRRAPRRTIASTAMVARSRPAPITNGEGSVWIAPAESGAVCTFIADPIDGYASSCATPEDIAAGAALLMVGGGSTGPLTDSAIVAAVVPDGAAPPTLIAPATREEAIPVISNVAAEVVPLGSVVHSGLTTLVVPKQLKPSCPAPSSGAGPRRCTIQ